MTQTKALAVDYFGMYDLLPNTPLAQRAQQHYEAVGVPKFTAEDEAFAKALQKAAGLVETGMTNAVTPLPDEPTTGGSTDVGDISWLTPTIGVLMPSVPEGGGVHTWMATASHGTDIGRKAAVTTAKVLALVGMDLLQDAEFRAQVRADFQKRTKGFTYKSPVPDVIAEPVGLPAGMRKTGSIADLKEAMTKVTGDHDYSSKGGHDHDD